MTREPPKVQPSLPAPPAPTVFLEPQPYRRRRLIDAARLLPVFGVALLVVPPALLPVRSASSSALLIYLVLVWAALVVAAALVARYMRASDLTEQATAKAAGDGARATRPVDQAALGAPRWQPQPLAGSKDEG